MYSFGVSGWYGVGMSNWSVYKRVGICMYWGMSVSMSIWKSSIGYYWSFYFDGLYGWGGRALHRKRLRSPAGLGKSLVGRTRPRSRVSVDCHCFAGLASRPVSRSVVDQQPTQGTYADWNQSRRFFGAHWSWS